MTPVARQTLMHELTELVVQLHARKITQIEYLDALGDLDRRFPGIGLADAALEMYRQAEFDRVAREAYRVQCAQRGGQ